MGLEWRWHHAWKRWSWEYEDFEKRVNWDWTIEARVEFWPLKDVVEFCRSLLTEILDIARCATCWGGVSIVWLVKTFKNCVSLLLFPWIEEETKKPFVPGMTESAYFCLYLYMYCITVVISSPNYVTVVFYSTSTVVG